MKKLTKKQQVKHYLSTGRTITPREAIDLFQAYRLAAIVSDLKKQGMKIVNLQNQFGNTVSISDYRGQVVVLTFLYSYCEDICPIVSNYFQRP